MQKAFTLIELLVVVLIIGILSAIALPQYRVAVVKARAMEVIIAMRGLETAQQEYFLVNNKWAQTEDELETLTIPISNTYCGGDFCQNTQLRDKHGILIEFVWPLQYRQHRCYAKTNNAVAKQVCQSLGGTWFRTADSYDQYVLP